MTLSPVPVEAFSGLDLVSDPGTVGWSAAIDVLNVSFDRPGQIRSRDGYANFDNGTLGASSNQTDLLPFYRQSASQLMVRISNTVYPLSSSGVPQTSQALTSSNASMVAWGDTTTSYVYCSSAYGAIKRWDGTTWTSPAGMPTTQFLGIQPRDNRLVAARTSTEDSKVSFSDAGAPETWGATNYVHLSPGDGGRIVGLVAWQNDLYVFKDSGRFFVFYGNSTDGTGNPVFNYRLVETGLRKIKLPTVGPDGIYFATDQAIYRTTGGQPERVSDPIRPLFTLETHPTYTLPGSRFGAVAMARLKDQMFIAGQAGTPYEVLVYNRNGGAWSVFDPQATSLTAFDSGAGKGEQMYFAYSSGGTQRVAYFDNTLTADAGSAITSRYRSGFSDLGTADMKRIHSWRAVGSGTPTLKLSTDFGSLETGAALTLGTSPAVAEGFRRYAPRGRKFSYQLGGTSAWSVNSLTAMVAGKRDAGEYTT